MQYENELFHRRRVAEVLAQRASAVGVASGIGALEATDIISSTTLEQSMDGGDFPDQILESHVPSVVAGVSEEGNGPSFFSRKKLTTARKRTDINESVEIEGKETKGTSRRRTGRRRRMRLDEAEIKANINKLAPIYRKRIFMQQLRNSWHWITLIVIGLVGASVAITFFLLPGGERLINVQAPPMPIKGRWGIVEREGRRASLIVEDLKYNNTPAVREIEEAIKDVYVQAGVNAEAVKLFHFPSAAKYRGRLQAVNKDSVILEHTVYLAPNTTNEINEADMKALIHSVRKILSNNASWVFDPNVLSVRRGTASAKASSVDSFLQSEFPPLDLKVRSVNLNTPLRIASCRALPKEPNSQVAPDDCHNRLKARSGLSCTTTCKKGYVISGSKVRVCMSNGIWNGWPARCEAPCSHLKYPSNGILSPRSCVANDGVKKPYILSGHNCFFFCNPGYKLIGSVRTTCQSDGRWSTVPSICKKTCPGLIPPDNGHVVPVRCSNTWVPEESFCTFFCDDEYVVRGEQTTSCLSDGTWTSEVPFCSSVCHKLPKTPNAKVHPSVCWQANTEAGMRCFFECEAGYQLMGSKERICQPTGIWSGSNPSCVKKCPKLGYRKNLLLSHQCALQSAIPETKCSFSCESGFQIQGQKDLVCLKDGSWNNAIPTCTAICVSLLQPTAGHIICSGNIETSECSLYCPNKHVLIGARLVVCTKGGSWSEPIGYCLNTCRKYSVPPHAVILPEKCGFQVSSAGEKCRFECADGYAISGSLKTQCLGTGAWSNSDTKCVSERQYLIQVETVFRKMCLKGDPVTSYVVKEDWRDCVPVSRHSKWALMTNRLIRNTDANHCLAASSTVPMTFLQLKPCDESDSLQIWDWSEFGENNHYLKLKEHDIYLWESYNSLSRIMTVGDVVSVKSTWKLRDVLRDKLLSFFGAYSGGKCSPLVNSGNGEWTPFPCSTTGVNSGSSCTFVCEAEYSLLEGKVKTQCDDGIWSEHATPHCVVNCNGLVAPTGSSVSIEPAECTEQYVKEETVCSANCANGTIPTGERHMICLRGGKWTFSVPHCAKICPTLVVTGSGAVATSTKCANYQGQHIDGSECGVTCDEGYVLSTPSHYSCSNGLWDHDQPVCKRKCEAPDNNFPKGTISCVNPAVHTEGDTCVVTCDRGYAPEGNDTIECMDSGLWSSNVPKCKKRCSAMANYTGLTFQPSECNSLDGVFEGTVCVASCATGYDLTGSFERTCLVSGTWTGHPSKCEAVASSMKFLMWNILNGVRVCLSTKYYLFYNEYRVIVKPWNDCDKSHQFDLWVVVADGRIRNVGSLWCLGIVGALQNYAPVQPQSCHNTDSERWQYLLKHERDVVMDESGKYYLHLDSESNTVEMLNKFDEDLNSHDAYEWLAFDAGGNTGSISGIGQNKCSVLVPQNGASFSLANVTKCQSQLVAVGESCTLFCSVGLQVNVPDPGTTYNCLALGQWSSRPVECLYSTCPPIVLHPNSVVDNPACVNSNSSTDGSAVCVITCSSGYTSVPANPFTSSTVCLANGRWSDPPPRCKATCSTLGDPADGSVTARCADAGVRLLDDDVCEFTCDYDYELSGNGTLECVNGLWSNAVPTCQPMPTGSPVSCLPLTGVYNGTLSPSSCAMNSASHGQICTLACPSGTASMLNSVQCQVNGKWYKELKPCAVVCSVYAFLQDRTMLRLLPDRCNDPDVPVGQRCLADCTATGRVIASAERHTGTVISCAADGQWLIGDESAFECLYHSVFKIKSDANGLCVAAPSPDLVIFTSCGSTERWAMWAMVRHTLSNRANTSLCLTLDSADSTISSVSLQPCKNYDHVQRWDCGYGDRKFEVQNFKGWKLTHVSGTNRVYAVAMRKPDNSLAPSSLFYLHDLLYNGNPKVSAGETICVQRQKASCNIHQWLELESVELDGNCKKILDEQHVKFDGAATCRFSCNSPYTLRGISDSTCSSGDWDLGPDKSLPQCLISCPALQANNFASVVSGSCTTQPVLPGTVCQFQCQNGYVATGDATVACRPDGKWSGKELICYKLCDPITQMPGADVDPPECTNSPLAPGTVCSTICQDGYEITGKASQLCMRSGAWSRAQASCTILCPILLSVTNGDIAPSDCLQVQKTAGNICVYQCDTGYSLVGTASRECQGDGLWSGSAGKCLRACPTLIAPANGAWTKETKIENVAGAVVKATCILDYTVDKDPVRTCLSTGKWTGEEVKCIREQQFVLFQSSPPSPKICVFADSSFSLEVRPFVECGRTARYLWAWEGQKNIRNVGSGTCLRASSTYPERYLELHSCDENDASQNWACNPVGNNNLFTLADSGMVPVYSTLSVSKVLLLSKESFKFVDEKSLAPVAHLQWSALTSTSNKTSLCSARKLNHCPGLTMTSHLTVTTKKCTQSTVPVGTECIFQCQKGYVIKGGVASTQCVASGLWNDRPPVCIASCDKMTLNKHVTAEPEKCMMSQTFHEGEICQFYCPENDTRVGDALAVCMKNGKWSSESPACKAICKPLKIPIYGRVYPETCADLDHRIVEGAECTLSCLQIEHSLSGSKKRTCMKDGKWSGYDSDCVKPCYELALPAHTIVSPLSCVYDKSLTGAICSFECKDGFLPANTHYRTCRENGAWSGRALNCQKYCAPMTEAMPYGMIYPLSCTHEEIAPGKECGVRCDSGFDVIGPRTVTCTSAGQWSAVLGVCKRKCPVPRKPLHGSLSPTSCLGQDVFTGTTCSPSCGRNYILKGSGVRSCTETGEWTGTDSECVPGCPPIGRIESAKLSPKSCVDSPQLLHSTCSVICDSEALSPEWGRVTVLVCLASGLWHLPIPKRCLRKCVLPEISNGDLVCDGETNEGDVMEGQKCRVECEPYHVTAGHPISTCVGGVWVPDFATCTYTPYPLVMVQRIDLDTKCLGIEGTNVVMHPWKICKGRGTDVQWSWKSRLNVVNHGSGLCLAALSREVDAAFIVSPCDGQDPLQRWDCDVEEPYRIFLRGTTLGPALRYAGVAEVTLQEMVGPTSLFYTFNPNSDDEIGTLCSLRPERGCQGLTLLAGTDASPSECRLTVVPTGTICQLSCASERQSILGASTIECKGSGLWSPEKQGQCLTNCQPLDLLPGDAYYKNTLCQSEVFGVNEMCYFACPDGFYMESDFEGVKCQQTGTWTAIGNVQCKKECPPLKKPENAKLTPEGCRSGTCTIVCDVGHRLNGPRTRTCEGSGQWSGGDFSCAKDVQFPISIKIHVLKTRLCLTVVNGNRVSKDRCVQDEKTQMWRWNAHYALENVAMEKCLAVRPSPINVMPRTSKTANDSEENDDTMGFAHFRNSSLPSEVFVTACDVTDAAQRWECDMKSPRSRFRVLLLDLGLYLDSGPQFTERVVLTPRPCRSTRWAVNDHEGISTLCSRRDSGVCPPLLALYGGAISPSLCVSEFVTVGTKCHFRCTGDFVIEGPLSTVCRKDGFWTNESPVCVGINRCPALVVKPPLVARPPVCEGKRVPVGRSCIFQCSDTHILYGNETMLCDESLTWPDDVPVCRFFCPPLPSPAGGSVSPESCQNLENEIGKRCTHTCSAGYDIIGSTERACQEDGSWSGTKTKCRKLCPRLVAPENARITPESCLANKSMPGAFCSVTCDAAFRLVGSPITSCDHGKWSDKLPVCSGDHCPRYHKDKNGIKSLAYSKLLNGAIVRGTILEFLCLEEYRFSKGNTRMCGSDGVWIGSSELCAHFACKSIPRLYHGKIDPSFCTAGRFVTTGTICSFFCEEGFTLTGPTSAECLPFGEWSESEFPECHDTYTNAHTTNMIVMVAPTGGGNAAGNLDEDAPMLCLLAPKSGERSPEIDECFPLNPFKLWRWFGSFRVQNVANQLCWGLDMSDKLILEKCSLNKTSQNVFCGDVSSKFASWQVFVGDKLLSHELRAFSNMSAGDFHWFAADSRIFDDASGTVRELNGSMRPRGSPLCTFMCGGLLTDEEGDFSTPNYPANYPSDVTCKWTIHVAEKVVRVDFSTLKLSTRSESPDRKNQHCFTDELLIFEGVTGDKKRYDVIDHVCSSRKELKVKTLHGSLHIELRSDHYSHDNQQGLAAKWFTEERLYLLPTCGVSELTAVDFHNTSRHGYPWQVAVSTWKRFCDGVFIGTRFALTAAHCVEHVRTADEILRIAVAYRIKSQNMFVTKLKRRDWDRADRLWIHPEYDREIMANNLAVLRLETGILQLEDDLQPACLPDSERGRVERPGDECVVSSLSKGLVKEPSQKWRFTRIAKAIVLSQHACETLLTSERGITFDEKSFLCVESFFNVGSTMPVMHEIGFIDNDGGSVLQCYWNENYYVVGIFNFALSDSRDGVLHVFTKIISNHEWIRDTVKGGFLKSSNIFK